jgi:hypothetical protein
MLIKQSDYTESSRRLPQIESDTRQSAKINLTGDNQIDADITAFINARKRILSQMKRKNTYFMFSVIRINKKFNMFFNLF